MQKQSLTRACVSRRTAPPYFKNKPHSRTPENKKTRSEKAFHCHKISHLLASLAGVRLRFVVLLLACVSRAPRCAKLLHGETNGNRAQFNPTKPYISPLLNHAKSNFKKKFKKKNSSPEFSPKKRSLIMVVVAALLQRAPLRHSCGGCHVLWLLNTRV